MLLAAATVAGKAVGTAEVTAVAVKAAGVVAATAVVAVTAEVPRSHW